MKHTECKNCELSNGDCGYHFKMDGTINYDIASLSACDKYGNCEFYKSKAKPKGDLISREALKDATKKLYNETLDGIVKFGIEKVYDLISNAPTVECPFNQETYNSGYEEGYLKGVKVGNDQKRKICDSCKIHERPQGYVDISKLRLMKVEECAGHTIDYAMGWKACIEWIKKGGASNEKNS